MPEVSIDVGVVWNSVHPVGLHFDGSFLKNPSIFFCRSSCLALPTPPPVRLRFIRWSLPLTVLIIIPQPINPPGTEVVATFSSRVGYSGGGAPGILLETGIGTTDGTGSLIRRLISSSR